MDEKEKASLVVHLMSPRHSRHLLSHIPSPVARYTVLMDFISDDDVKSDLGFAIISLVCLNVDLPYFNSLILLYVIKLSVTLQVPSSSFLTHHDSLTVRML
jgi:hypothetical protein